MWIQDYLSGLVSDGIFMYLWLALPVFALFSLLQHHSVRQFFSRFQANVRAKCELDEQQYHLFGSIELSEGGKTVAADKIYVSRFGIFVVNTPNRQGRIWGDNGNGEWTQMFHKAKVCFANPIEQNHTLIRLLSRQLKLPVQYFHSMVVFSGCRFQTMMPDSVLDESDFQDYVAQFDEELLDDEKVAYLKTLLEASEFDTVFENRAGQAWHMS